MVDFNNNETGRGILGRATQAEIDNNECGLSGRDNPFQKNARGNVPQDRRGATPGTKDNEQQEDSNKPRGSSESYKTTRPIDMPTGKVTPGGFIIS